MPGGTPVGSSRGSCFNYLPGTFLLTAPGRWLGGDVRWIEAGRVVAAAALVSTGVNRQDGRLRCVAVLVAALPGTLLVVQQAWTEPMLLLALCGCAVALDQRRGRVAVLAAGLALANKQHIVVLLPFLLCHRDFGPRRVLAASATAVAVCVPWVLADPVRFTACVADFYLDEATPRTSVPVWQWLPAGWALPVLLIGTATATAIAVRHCRTGGTGLLLGSGLVSLTFDLLNKQTYLNQWWLAATLVAAGLALTDTRGAGEFHVTDTLAAGEPHVTDMTRGAPVPRPGELPSRRTVRRPPRP